MSRKATGLVELHLGPSTGKRKRQSLVGGTIVDEYTSALHGRVVVVKVVPRQAKAAPKPKAVVKAAAVAHQPGGYQPGDAVTHGA